MSPHPAAELRGIQFRHNLVLKIDFVSFVFYTFVDMYLYDFIDF